MRQNRRTAPRNLVLALSGLALVALCLPATSLGADRMVLAEEFTATW